jgi:hypothetical protein
MSGIYFRGSVIIIGRQNDGEIHGEPIEIKDRPEICVKPIEVKDHRIGGHKIHGKPIEIKGPVDNRIHGNFEINGHW